MKPGDKIVYIGESNNLFTHNKKYVIDDVEIYYSPFADMDGEYVYFYNNLNSVEWIKILELEKYNFLTEKEYRKQKLEKILK